MLLTLSIILPEKKNSETSFPRVNEDRRDLIVTARDPIKGN